MAKSIASLPVFFYLLLGLPFDSVGNYMDYSSKSHCHLCRELTEAGQWASKTWCVAKPSANASTLASNINYACDYLGFKGLNCSQIQPEGACFDPDTLINHASYTTNSYYQAYGRQSHQCYFTNSALITVSDPSFGNCQYA